MDETNYREKNATEKKTCRRNVEHIRNMSHVAAGSIQTVAQKTTVQSETWPCCMRWRLLTRWQLRWRPSASHLKRCTWPQKVQNLWRKFSHKSRCMMGTLSFRRSCNSPGIACGAFEPSSRSATSMWPSSTEELHRGCLVWRILFGPCNIRIDPDFSQKSSQD